MARRLQRTQDVGAAVQKLIGQNPAVEHVFFVAGFDVIAGGNKTNAATIFIPLKPWDERKETAEDVAKYHTSRTPARSRRQRCLRSIRRRSAVLAPPAVSKSTCRTAPTPTRRSSTRLVQQFLGDCASVPT